MIAEIGGFLAVPLLWIHQNLCGAQWPRVGTNIDYIEIIGLFTVTWPSPFNCSYQVSQRKVYTFGGLSNKIYVADIQN